MVTHHHATQRSMRVCNPRAVLVLTGTNGGSPRFQVFDAHSDPYVLFGTSVLIRPFLSSDPAEQVDEQR